MYQLDKCIFVTNNDRAAEEFSGRAAKIILLEDYRDVLVQVRDLIYAGHKLLSHPQASSLKPNQTPYRTILVYGEQERVNLMMSPSSRKPLRPLISGRRSAILPFTTRRSPTTTRPSTSP